MIDVGVERSVEDVKSRIANVMGNGRRGFLHDDLQRVKW